MARVKNNGNGRLEEAMAKLAEEQKRQAEEHGELEKALRHMLQTQALHQQNQAENQRDLAESRRELSELRRQADQRFARIEAILLEHTRILQALPDAVREKIGYKMPEQR